jgi:oxygen-dependent protoporphyrinogen oxidase
MRQIAILGGGISSLAAAWYLQKRKDLSVTILEKENRLGGLIRSRKKNGYFFEAGPRAFRASDSQEALDLIQELGLHSELITGHAQSRFLYHQGKLEPIPKKLAEFLLSPLMKGCFSALFRDLFAARASGDESVYDFFKRRFSAHTADQWIDPLIKGIYAGDPKKLSVQACFPKLWELEAAYRCLLWGAFRKKKAQKTASHLITLKSGLETWVLELGKRNQGEILLNFTVEKITFDTHQAFVHGRNRVCAFDAIISTLPACALSSIIDDPTLQADLKSIPFASIGVVHLGYSRKAHPFQGFGYLVPEYEKQPILGTVFDSEVFPQQNQTPDETRLTVMIGGASRPDLVADDRYLEAARNVVEKHLGIQSSPEVIFGSVARQAIPQFPVGFPAVLERIKKTVREKYPLLFLLGSSFCGVSVNQAIARARKFAEETTF